MSNIIGGQPKLNKAVILQYSRAHWRIAAGEPPDNKPFHLTPGLAPCGRSVRPKLYWNTISGSPFYQVAQPWMKDYVNQVEFNVVYKKVWLDK